MPDERTAPELLTRVSRSWRCLALATPQLWSGLRLKLPTVIDTEMVLHLKRSARTLDTYLFRSGAYPLSLDIDLSKAISTVQWDVIYLFINSVTSSILPHSHRWRHLSLSAPLQFLLPVYAHLNSAAPTKLESLSLDFSDSEPLSNLENEQENFTVSLNMECAERLKDLTIYGNSDNKIIMKLDPCNFPASLSSVVLWNVRIDLNVRVIRPFTEGLTRSTNAVRKLCLGASITPEHLLVLLRASPLLEELIIDLKIIGREPYSREPRLTPYQSIVSMHNLRTLRICLGESTSELLDRLLLPALTSLEYISGEAPEASGMIQKLISLLRRSGASLSFFMLCDGLGNVHEEELIELLQQMPSLKELRILKQGLSDRTLLALTMRELHASVDNSRSEGGEMISVNEAYALCPGLASITFTGGNEFSSQAIIDLILSRRKPSRRRLTSSVSPLSPKTSVVETGSISASSLIRSSMLLSSDSPSGRVHGRCNDLRLEAPVSQFLASGTVSLTMLQAVVAHPELVAEHHAVRRCVEEGLELHLRGITEFVPRLQ